MINVFQPCVGADEIKAVTEVFVDNWLGRGQRAIRFEHLLAAELGVRPEQILTINSCTTGLFLSMKLLGIGKYDEVIIPSIHFVGAANAIVAAGAEPVFIDVDPGTLNATMDDVLDSITSRTKAVLLLHYGGIPCEVIGGLAEILEERNIALIEDAACSFGSTWAKQTVGTFGDIGLWSFDAMKYITTGGDGGAIYCRDAAMIQEAREWLWFGLNKTRGLDSDSAQWWEFDVSRPGAYGLMNDLQAAIGIAQMKRLDSFTQRRQAICQMYNERLSSLSEMVRLPQFSGEETPNFYWIQLRERDNLAHFLKRNGIYTTFRYYPLHRIGLYGPPPEREFVGTDYVAAHTLLLPMHPGLTDQDVTYICDRIEEWIA